MAKARPIRHLMVNTNGVRIAQEEDFVKRLAEVKEDFEVYLQFDSFERDPLMQLRGADLRRIREQAIEHLNRYNISTNLVVTLKKGLNDHEVGKTIDYALQQSCVRGVTFQPIQDTGRIDIDCVGTDAFVRPADPERSEGACDSGKRTITGGSPRSFNPSTDRLTLTEIRRKILEQTNVFKPKDVIPVP
jgi:7,8-dihydro-6-hydroxymethylpterin dimethyltransferase